MCGGNLRPVLSVSVYEDGEWARILETVDRTSPYALTGAVFANDRRAIRQASTILRDAAGTSTSTTSRRARS